MNTLRKTVLGIAGLIAASAPANAAVIVGFGDTDPIPASNNFQGNLASLGLVQVATTGASLVLDQNSIITFSLLGSESGFNDTFSTSNISYTEFTSFLNSFGSPIALGSTFFSAGSLAGLLTFTSSGGASATVGSDGFGIFLGPNAASGDALNVFYIGYDDQITSQDDDHDDFIIRATVAPATAVPEPATWAMLLLGLGTVGYGMRRARRRPKLIQMA